MESAREAWETGRPARAPGRCGPAEGRMRTSKISTLVVSALAALALAATACSGSNGTSQPAACTAKQLDAACGAGSECCSGSCANGICAKPSAECHAVGGLCAAASDCCLG